MQRIRPRRAYAPRPPRRIQQWPPSQAASSLQFSTEERPSWRRPLSTASSQAPPTTSSMFVPSSTSVLAGRNLRCSAIIGFQQFGSINTNRKLLLSTLPPPTTTTTGALAAATEEEGSGGINKEGEILQSEDLMHCSASDFEDKMLRMDECLANIQTALVDLLRTETLSSGDSNVDVVSMFEDAIRRASEAHELLEGAVPELSHRHHPHQRQIPSSIDPSNSSTNTSTTGADHRLALPRCCQLLDAWSQLCRIGHDLTKTHRHQDRQHQHAVASQLRGVPQRAQYVLDQMERTIGLSPPPPHAYHSVMECWAYSNEHRRATMAEAVFQRLYGPKSPSTQQRGTVPAERPEGGLSPQKHPHQRQQTHGRRRPTIEAHRIMVHAWGRSTRDPRAAFHATGHLMKMVKLVQRQQGRLEYEDDVEDSFGGDDASEPTMDDFRVVMEAWTRAEDKNSPSKAYSALRLMENAHARGWTTAHPDLDCYRAVLQTAARRPALPDLDALVDSVLMTMKHQLIPPDTACYEAAAEVYKNMALLNSGMMGATGPSARAATAHKSGTISAVTSPSSVRVTHDPRVREKCVNRALELLEEIQVAQNQQGEAHAQLSTRIVNQILEAQSVSRSAQRSEIATQLLSKLEEALVADGNQSQSAAFVRSPNLETYRLVLDVWKSVPTCSAGDDEAKLAGAEAILDRLQLRCNDIVRMQQQCNGASGRQIRNGLVAIYNAFIDVCGTANTTSEESNTATFRLALTRLQGLRTLNVSVKSGEHQCPLSLSPNAESYACLLAACAKLLPNGKDRQRWVDRVFRLACDEGMVDDGVLRQLRLAVSDDQYSRLVISASESVDGTKLVPEAWTRNALRGRVVTSEGRRTTPLTVQGRLTVTPAMQEFRMRRLRDHRNRNLLQGGRLQLGNSTSKS